MFGRWRKKKEHKATTDQSNIEKEHPVKKGRTTMTAEDATAIYGEFIEELDHIYSDGNPN